MIETDAIARRWAAIAVWAITLGAPGCLVPTPGYSGMPGTTDGTDTGPGETGETGGEGGTGTTETGSSSSTAGDETGETSSESDSAGATTDTTTDGTDTGDADGVSLFGPNEAPASPDDDPSSLEGVELGTRFSTDTPGAVTKLRFYKVSEDTGPHVLHLWSPDGMLLAAAPFSDPEASGWQEIALAQPVQLEADTEYVVSYHTASGFYAITQWYFKSAGVDAAPLHAPQSQNMNGSGNGVFAYGASRLPTETWRASNYFADVVFVP